MPLRSDEEIVCAPGTCPVCDGLRAWIAEGVSAGADPGQIMLVFVTLLQEQSEGAMEIMKVDGDTAQVLDAMTAKKNGDIH
jgi:hypothetical protein